MRHDAASLPAGGRPAAGAAAVRTGRREGPHRGAPQNPRRSRRHDRHTTYAGRDAAGKAPWYLPSALCTDALGAALPVLLLFQATGQPRPVAAAAVAAGTWLGVQAAHRRYTRRTLGESRGLLAVVHDWLILLGLLAVFRVFTGESSAPAYALLALVPAPLLAGLCRVLTHRHLTAERREAHAVCRVLVVGEAGPLDEVVDQLAARTDHPYVVIGAVTVGGAEPRSGVQRTGVLEAPAGAALPGGGSTADGRAGQTGPAHPAPPDDGPAVLEAARRTRAEMVLVAPGAALTGERLRRLTWSVQDAGLSLALASGLAGVALRRIHPASVGGLNLLHVAAPTRRGPQHALKTVLDRVGAALGLVLLAPVFALLAAVIRLDSPGPALYRQTRTGLDGRPFTMWKFRSMVTDADRIRPLLAAADEQDGPTFKIRRDPRVTRVGRVLRRTSLDELPQLLNVVRGEMSLVGPRPPLPDEVAAYDSVALRRLRVRPGLTGPWQVGGRSDLSWDESLALDLSYADNWSLTTDLDVLARTFRAVVDGRGAY
ncbi:sugar transferase [Streptomyces sp. JJ36]|nr:sugar transferase [Streptomyces sp. JJ36]